MRKKSLGNLGENLALKRLKNKGYKFIERNFRSNYGEIDLIFIDGDTLVFVEVKTRIGEKYGEPVEAVNQSKINSIVKTGQYFCLKNPNLPESLRIDVCGIDMDEETEEVKSFEHFKNVTL